ncbi:MAG: putative transporter [Bacteroidaceae bacterium]|nr:putative transporter [Bacteroidaceae bacterium]
MNWIVDLVTDTNSLAHIIILFSLVISAGMALGKVKFGGIALGATFVLFVGILIGHIYTATGLANEDNLAAPAQVLSFIQDFGLILFVYCIGLQVGPGFFHSFKTGGGLQMNYIAIGIVLLNVATMLGLYYLVFAPRGDAKDLPMMVGVLYGAVTNTPGLGAAQEALKSFPNLDMGGLNIASGYACAYPLGVVGIIGATIALRFICRISLKDEEDAIRQAQEENPHAKPHRMTLKVTNHSIHGKKLSQIREFLGRTFVCTRMQDVQGNFVAPGHDTLVEYGSLLNLVCAEDDAEAVTAFIGEVVEGIDWKEEKAPIISRRILVTQSNVQGKTFGQMHFSSVYGVNVTRITRQGMELFADRALRIQIGDRLLVAGSRDDVDRVERVLGNSVKRLDHPNIGAIFLGILIGIICGTLPLALPGMSVPLKLGLAGGPLVVAILIGAYSYKFHLNTYMTSGANLFIRELGLSLFLAAVGIKAGSTFWNTVTQGDGLIYVWTGFIITVLPLLIMGFIARKVYKFNYFTLMGIIAGSTTDPPALGYANQTAGNDAPSVGYSTVYPLSMFLRILFAQAIILFLCS